MLFKKIFVFFKESNRWRTLCRIFRVTKNFSNFDEEKILVGTVIGNTVCHVISSFIFKKVVFLILKAKMKKKCRICLEFNQNMKFIPQEDLITAMYTSLTNFEVRFHYFGKHDLKFKNSSSSG